MEEKYTPCQSGKTDDLFEIRLLEKACLSGYAYLKLRNSLLIIDCLVLSKTLCRNGVFQQVLMIEMASKH